MNVYIVVQKCRTDICKKESFLGLIAMGLLKYLFRRVKGGPGLGKYELHCYHTLHSKAIRFTLALTLPHGRIK